MELYEYQKQAVREAKDRWLLNLDVGLGKSAVTLTLANMKARSVLIITTKSLKRNWENEKKMWLKNPLGVKIMSKEEFRRDWDDLDGYDAVIFDEFHFFGSYTSKMHKAAKAYLNKWNPKFIWGATATPELSSVMSVWCLSLLLGRPLGSFGSFQAKYFHKVYMNGRFVPMQKKGIEKEIALDIRKIGTVMSKEECLDLPDTVHEFEWFDLTAEQKKAIKKLDEDPTTILPIVMNTKILQICGGTLKQPDESYLEIKGEKLARLLELVEQFPKCVVVCRQRAEIELIHSKIKNSYVYNGDTDVNERDEIIRKVNAGEGTMIAQADMLIGFNLVGISLMIFYSHSYDYVKYYQSLGRIHRIGQKNNCTYIHMIVKGTIDEEVWKCLERKEGFDIALYNREKK